MNNQNLVFKSQVFFRVGGKLHFSIDLREKFYSQMTFQCCRYLQILLFRQIKFLQKNAFLKYHPKQEQPIGFFSKVVGKESSWQKIISVEISLKSVALLWPAVVAECWSLSLKYVEFKLMQFLPEYRHLVPRTSFTRKSCCAKSRLDIIDFI